MKTHFIILYIYCIALTAAVIYLFLNKQNADDKNEISVSKLTITDSTNQRRLILSPQLPDPYLNGKEYEREIDPSGMVFYDANGNECGGIAVNNYKDQELNVLAFDYDNSEAVFLFKSETENLLKYHSGLTILDKPNPSKSPKEISPSKRIILDNNNGNAGLTIYDKHENPRIVLSVDTLDNASVRILNEKGEVKKELK